MSKFRKTALIEASQWFKNGDHPDDYTIETIADAATRRAQSLLGEGAVVRYYRHPNVPGEEMHKCGYTMHFHGWIDTLEGGHNVCPGDWIATGAQGEHWPIKPDIFEATYEAAD